MLALTRKTGDAIMINNNIEITVLEVRGDQVKIGISAPKDISIYRKEVYLEIQKENEAAQQISMDDVEAIKNLL
ncbi:carbon storage regulator, CsrA [Pseudobutyrivibrio sp. 49]|uniref:carbon storage regulator CsrA n=1 Tax=unclassified Pseudobutyrivibrio TaxID=2638619 RepID=UPI000885F0A9|nr:MULTISPECIES: carbon storage regulator CsrA [unclassified Pseudobutyrivibrio]SDH74619.1 carbon storage regulator, CsrA [Pseudobutyrivibrio sp. 49]SFN76519.1 carbon storage regulator, CsrA [Pseudobutyrivibrio sp. UC1225]